MLVRFAVLVLLVVGAAGCGGDEQGSDTTRRPGEIAFDLSARGDASVAGVRARLLYEEKNRTTIIVDGFDEGEAGGGGANPARLYRGSCNDLGEVVERLHAIQGSSSKSTVRLGVAALLEGDYAIAVGLPGSADEVLACGDVPDEAPTG
jgi:hypothetical protein